MEVESYDFNGIWIFTELKARGYTGSIEPVYHFLNKVDEDVGDGIIKKTTINFALIKVAKTIASVSLQVIAYNNLFL